MRVRLSLLTLTAVLFCLFSTAYAQNQAPVNESDLLNQIREEIRIEQGLIDSTIQEIKAVQERIAAYKMSGKASARLKRLIESNNVDSLQTEFDKYAKRIDIALLNNPDDAEKQIATVRSLFGGVSFLADDIDYYDGALLFYRKADIRVVSHFSSFLAKYQDSNVSTKALALYLRSMINLNNERLANEQYTSLYSTITSNEITYLLGHIKFSLAMDADATTLFTQLIEDQKFGTDSKLMLEFIQALNSSVPDAINQFKNLDAKYASNPFIVLALARMYVNNSDWKLAEDQYKKFYTLVQNYREINSQYELVLAYLNAGEKAKATQLLNELLQRKDLGSYYPTLLYLWADIKAEDGEFSEALQKFDDFFAFSVEAKTALEQKKLVLGKIEGLKARLYQDPSPESYEVIKRELLALSDDLAKIHETLMAKASVIPSDIAEQLYKYEMQTILHYKAQFDSYVAANQLRNYPDTDKLALIENVKNSYALDEKAYELIQQRLNQIINDNYEYQRQLALEADSKTDEEVISVIDQILLKTTDPIKIAELESQKAEYSAKLAESKQLQQYYAFDNSLSTFYQEEFTDFQNQKRDFDDLYPHFVQAYKVSLPNKIANREMAQIKKDIDSYEGTTVNYSNVVTNLLNSLNKSEISIDFVRLQMAYKDLDFRTQQHDKVKNDMAVEQSAAIVNSLTQEKLVLRDRFSSFLQKTPKFKYLQQPGGTFLISEANLYYDMAELSYAIDRANPQLALDYYIKTNQADPNFYMRDAVLYNIGFIHSSLIKERIDRLTDEFFANDTGDMSRPESIRLTEAKLAETLDAYQEIANNYKNSRFYDEVMLRLGIIYFNLGADAAEPAVYYAKARDYFNVLIAKEGSDYQYQALYQRGWVYLNGSDEASFRNGLNDFVSILKAINEGKITKEWEIKDYTATAIQNIAYCLVGLDLGDYVNRPKGSQFVMDDLKKTTNKEVLTGVIDEAIKTKFELEAPMQAADYIRLKVTIDPLAINNPVLIDSVLTIYKKYQNQLRPGQDIYALRDSIYYEIKSNYNGDSAWYAANKDKQIDKQIQIIKTAYDEIDTKLYNNFVKTPNEQNYVAYNAHIADYSKYEAIIGDSISLWTQDKAKIKTLFSTTLAERLPSIFNYLQAINQLHDFNSTYPDNDGYLNNEGLSYEYAKKIFNLASVEDSTKTQETLPEQLSTPDKVFAFYTAAADRFMQTLLSDKFVNKENRLVYVGTQKSISQLEYDRKMYDAAKQRYLQILNLGDSIDNNTTRDAYIQLAKISVDEQKYDEAESWYRKAEPIALNNEDRVAIHSQINIQIQSSVEQATANNDFMKVAQENMRLAKEFENSNNDYNRKFRIDAYSAFKKAGEYQMAINVIKDLATQTTDVDQAFDFYQTAWNDADTLLTDMPQSKEIKTTFMQRFPSSNQTFNIRLRELDKIAANPAMRDTVSAQYIALYEDVKNKRIVPNDEITLDQLYRSAIAPYITADKNATVSAEDMAKRDLLIRNYITMYPKDPLSTDYFETVLLVDAFNSGDTEKYERVARELFAFNKTKYQAYQAIAEQKLQKTLDIYIAAYESKDWQKLFAARDDYNKQEAAFIKEGLSFEHGLVKTNFTATQKEYDQIQARLAFLKSYDQKLDGFEAAIRAKSPGQLIAWNTKSKWKDHLTGGRENRIGAYKNSVNASVKQVQKYLDSVADKDLDNDRILRGFNIMARMYEYAGEVVKAQTDKYFSSSIELANVKATSDTDYYNTIVSGLMRTRDGLVNEHIIEAITLHVYVYNNFGVPGFKDKYTEYSSKFLEDHSITPQYAIDEIPLNSSWSKEVLPIEGANSGATANFTSTINTSNGVTLGGITVPAGTKVSVKKNLNTRIAPVFGIVNYVSLEDIEIALNGKIVEPYTDVPIDTLKAINSQTVRFAATIPYQEWSESANEISITLSNTSTQPVTVYLGMQLVNDQRKLYAAIPTEVIVKGSDTSWTTYYTDPASGKAVISKAVDSTKFGLPIDNIEGLAGTTAKLIWVPESDSSSINEVVFETQLNIDTEFRKGTITFVAPANATILINGVPVLENQDLAYIDEPLEMFPITYDIDKSNIVNGLNKIQFRVSNSLPYRGFAAEVSIEKTQKR